MTETEMNGPQNGVIKLQPNKEGSTIVLERGGGFSTRGNVNGQSVEVVFEAAKLFINPTESPRINIMGNGELSGYYSFDDVIGLKDFAQKAVLDAIPSEANHFRNTFPQLFEE